MRASVLASFASAGFVILSCAAPARAQSSVAASGALAIPENFVAAGPLHRVIARADDPVIDLVTQLGALVAREDYGSFSLLVVDATFFGGVDVLPSLGLQLADEGTLINLNGWLLDGADLAGTAARLADIPPELLAEADAPDARHLRLVQFAGPIKDAWLDTLRQTGAHVVSYVPNNAYVVRADAAADMAVTGLKDKPYVLSVGSYRPAFKLRPELRPPQLQESGTYAVIVQVIADDEGAAFAATLPGPRGRLLAPPNPVLDYLNVELQLDGAGVLELAADSRVFAIEPKRVAAKMDERQGVVVAGQLNAAGTQPSAPGYLAWLASKGFPGADPFPFLVDVTDDGLDKGSASDVNVEFKVGGQAAGASRVVYVANYTFDALGDGQAGHGNINASIVGGYSGGTGTAVEDSLAYNYGLGIAPWVKLGSSKVFANNGDPDFLQPANVRLESAFNAGARISSNSWGYIFDNTYNVESQLHDKLVRDAMTILSGNQELAIVFSAGNEGPGANTVSPPATAKNVISVGAGENWRMTGSDGCGIGNSGADNVQDIIGFSSRGPVADGRRKPDIMAPGTHIEGAASRAVGYTGFGVCDPYWPLGQTLYAWSSGTSHSTPAISGCCALVRQWCANNGLGTPSPALLKAWLVGSTTYMTGVSANDTLWSNNQGFGRVNLARAFDAVPRVTVDQAQVLASSGATYTLNGNVAGTSQPFRVVLAWTDAPGPTTGGAWVNNLDLEVTVGGTLYRGNVFSGASSTSGGVADTRNNMECVFRPSGTSGAFSVTVRATNVAGDGVPANADSTDQDFALVVYNASTVTGTPDFSLAAIPLAQTITAGSSTAFTVTETVLFGFASNVTLSAAPAISGVSFSFAPNPVAPGGSSTLTCTTTAAAATGAHSITITGTGGGKTHTAGVTLVINPAPPHDFTLSANPASASITAGGSANFTISNTALNGFAGNITLAASPAIAGVSYAFTPNPLAPNGSSTFTCTTTAGAATGPHPITITGTSGALVRTANVTLTINPTGGGNAVKTYSLAPALAIPDNNVTGVTSTLGVPDALTVSSLSVGCNITHSYKGDLVVTLIGPDGTSAILHNRTGGSADNVMTTYAIATAPAASLSVFNGKSTAGSWKLKVQDLAAQDLGTLNNWTITFNGEQSVSPGLAIPDNNATGVTSALSYVQTGTVASIKVKVGITHTYQGDLRVSLIAPDGTTVILHNLTGAGTDNLNTEYPDLTAPAQALSAFTGKSIAGSWKLKVVDLAAQDVGTLNSWTLSIGAQ